MVLDDYSNMSIDELGSSLLQKKADDERRAAKKSRKNERVQKALGVLLMGQGLMKNQYTKRVKELEDMHKFEIMDNESQAREIAMHSQLTGKIGNTWKDEGGDLESRFNSFESSDDYSGFAQEARPYIDQKIKALSPQDYEDLYGTATYENAVRLATKQFAENYLKTDTEGVAYYKKQEQLLRDILDDSEGKNMDRLTLFTRGAGLTTASLTAYDRKNYQRVLNEYRSQNNLVGGFKRVLGLFNDKQIKKGGVDLFSAMTEDDLAGPLINDITQALNLKGMTNSLGASLDKAKKSPTVWREMAERSSQYKTMRERTADFKTGPLAGMLKDIEDGVYPSELGGTMTNISASNIEEFFEAMNTPERSGQKADFIFDTTALAIRLSKDKQFREDVWRNTEGKKKNGKSLDEFEFILQNENDRIKFSAMMAIDVGFDKDDWGFDGGAKYNSYGTLIGIYDTMKLSRVVGEGVSVQNNGKIKLSDTYTRMKPEQKKQAIDDEVNSIILDPKNNANSIAIKLNGLSKEIQRVFGQNLEEYQEEFQKRNTPKSLKEEALEQAGAIRTPLPFETSSRTDTTEELLGTPAENIEQVSVVTEEPEEIKAKATMVNAVLTEADEDKPEEIKDNRLIPINIRQMMYDIFGGDGDVTEEDLSGNELTALRSIITPEVLRKGKLEYKDYATTEGDNVYSDVGGGGQGSNPIAKSFSDPAYALKTTLGQARVFTDKNGNVIIEDRYNFNDADDQVTFDSFLDDLRAIKSDWKYFLPRKTAKYFGSREGEGSKIMINLGKLDLGTFV